MQRLAGTVALVTGGARGIGEGIVRRFIAEGAKVMISDVLVSEGEALAHELGSNAAFIRQDVADRAGWDTVIATVEAKFGKLDILVNNAGVIVFKKLDDLSEAEMRRIIDINLMGTMFGTQAAIPALERAGGGTRLDAREGGELVDQGLHVVQFGGHHAEVALRVAGHTVTPLSTPGNVPRDLHDKGFRIYPAQRAGDPSDIGAAAAYLASDDARYCMGTELSVDGGLNAGH